MISLPNVSDVVDLLHVTILADSLQKNRGYPSSGDDLQPLSAGISLFEYLRDFQQVTIEALADPNQLSGYVRGYWETIQAREMTKDEEAIWGDFLVHVADQAAAKLDLFKVSLEYILEGDGCMVPLELRDRIGAALQALAEGEALCRSVEDWLLVFCAEVSAEIKREMELEESISQHHRKDVPRFSERRR